ncbi:post-transcriptional regulator [Paenibacillus sp. UMB4589-SE434]|uniref:post-transcriptional regulator n=1 Tax=Paenibacillus sp. UMB4589-SE434 TaxID=3046314 RepID=UPI00254FD29E|nr:post-transcriptional regulator [Paenibacillus sp. UMB4589-SE434]MDK8181171.1 post-transcriptional regulator [Paenibacillus sp. UMB4589-SE434]
MVEQLGVELDLEVEMDKLQDEDVELLCQSKAEEFHLIGYEHVTAAEVWECVSEKYKKSGEPAVHEVVNDILSLKVTKFMNYMTMSAYRGSPFS